MEADLHGLSLMALPVLTVLACLTFCRGAPSGRRIVLGLAAAGAAWALQPAYSHPCEEGRPVMQWLLPVLCIAPAVIFIHRRLVATTAAVVLLAMAPVLSNFYLDFVHREECTGNPELAASVACDGSPSRLKEMEEALKRLSAGDSRDHPPGWLRNSELWTLLPEEERLGDEGLRIEVDRFWHSWITGLYPERRVDQAIWYPGGRIAEAAGRIEFRDVPGDSAPGSSP